MASLGKKTRQLVVARTAGLVQRGKSLVDQQNMQYILACWPRRYPPGVSLNRSGLSGQRRG